MELRQRLSTGLELLCGGKSLTLRRLVNPSRAHYDDTARKKRRQLAPMPGV